jgi:hypothetical protein
VTAPKLTKAQRDILMSATGDWCLVQFTGTPGDEYRRWQKRVDRLMEIGYLVKARMPNSYFVQKAGLSAIGMSKPEIRKRGEARRLAAHLASLPRQLIEADLPETASKINDAINTIGPEMAKRFPR